MQQCGTLPGSYIDLAEHQSALFIKSFTMPSLNLILTLSLFTATLRELQGVEVKNRSLTFMLITSFGQFGFNSSGIVPAADLALEKINNDSGILNGYRLEYDKVWDSQVRVNSQLSTALAHYSLSRVVICRHTLRSVLRERMHVFSKLILQNTNNYKWSFTVIKIMAQLLMYTRLATGTQCYTYLKQLMRYKSRA